MQDVDPMKIFHLHILIQLAIRQFEGKEIDSPLKIMDQ